MRRRSMHHPLPPGRIVVRLALAIVLAGAALFAGAAAILSVGQAVAEPAVPKAGSPAPAFTLTTGEGKSVNLSDYHGKWVVLYFYPKDFTSGCTIEAHNFQRDLAKYEQTGAVILGVSVDSPESHKGFCAKEGLGFTLLSDPDARVSTSYGSVMEYEGAAMSERNTFLIDPEGKIARAFVKVNPTKHSDEVLAALAKLQGAPPAKASSH